MAETKIFARLKADHDRHRKLLDQIDETKGDSSEREKLFEAFRVEVTAHAASEEMSLYATMLGKPDLREDAQHSVSEHKEIDDMLTELYEMDFASTGWLTPVSYTHLRAHETVLDLVCLLLLEKKKT